MNKFKIASALATATLVAATFAPSVFADTTVDVTGNGAHSDNTVNVTTDTNSGTSVSQTNNTTVVTTVTANSNTGGNKANNNTGGDVNITTGAASTDVTVAVAGGTNNAVNTDPCGCNGDTTVTIDHNGAHSTNTVNVGSGTGNSLLDCILWFCDTNTGNTVKQKNNTTVLTTVKAKSNTGKNKANGNTHGTVNITTHAATTGVGVAVTGSSNTH